MPLIDCLKRYLRGLSPYAALFVMTVPFFIIEPLKLVAAIIFGSGHWVTGILVMLVAYALSIFIVERIFLVIKPKLLRLPWFVALWKMFVALRKKTWRVTRGFRLP
jgi:ABC-type uncharacterized transport system permease subunit